MESAGQCTLQNRFQSFFLIRRWSGCYLASSPVNQWVVLEQPIHSQDYITRGIKVGNNKQDVSWTHGRELNGESDHFSDPDGGGPIYKNDLPGGHWSFLETESGDKFGVNETEFSAGG